MIPPFSEKARQAVQGQMEFSLDAESIKYASQYIEATLRSRGRETSADSLNVKQLAVCKAILSLCPYTLIARFSDYYSMLWAKVFRDNETEALEFAKEIFPSLQLQPASGGFTVTVFEYLNAEESISLARILNGIVFLSNEELIEVLARQVKRRILTLPSQPVLPEEVKQAALQLSKQFAVLIPRSSKQLEKQEIKLIRLGVSEGGRFYACMKLVRACFNDGLSLEEAKQVTSEFVKACPPSKNPFTEKEALNCLEWMYRKGRSGPQAFETSGRGETNA